MHCANNANPDATCNVMKEPNYRPRPRWIVNGGEEKGKNIKDSQKQERRVERLFREIDPSSRITPGSGSKSIKGDIQGGCSFVECKETNAQSISISVDWLGKVETYASEAGKMPVLCLSFLSPVSSFRRKGGKELSSRDWVVMPEWLFMEMAKSWSKK